MPRAEEMTYVASQKRWQKHYGGKNYAVSCKQLGCPPGREASRLAANAWWASKQQEIDASSRNDRQAAQDYRSMEELLGRPIANEADYDAQLRILRQVADRLATTRRNLGEQLHGNSVDLLDGLPSCVASVQSQAEGFLSTLRARRDTRDIHPARYEAYARDLSKFVAWLGTGVAVTAINSFKLEEYRGWVGTQVAERRWSSWTARNIMLTARKFVGWLARHGTIPLPGNLHDRSLSVGLTPTAIAVYTDEQVRALLTTATDRTRLYVLLALNCGMLQSDISDLGADEIDWTAGTITRRRSKTKRGLATTWKLWPETLGLLKTHRAKATVPNDRGSTRVLLGRRDTPLLRYQAGAGAKKLDSIKDAYGRLLVASGVGGSFKVLRKTGATRLQSHPVYGRYDWYYCAHAPQTVTAAHYSRPSQELFDEALAWLRQQWLSAAQPHA